MWTDVDGYELEFVTSTRFFQQADLRTIPRIPPESLIESIRTANPDEYDVYRIKFLSGDIDDGENIIILDPPNADLVLIKSTEFNVVEAIDALDSSLSSDITRQGKNGIFYDTPVAFVTQSRKDNLF